MLSKSIAPSLAVITYAPINETLGKRSEYIRQPYEIDQQEVHCQWVEFVECDVSGCMLSPESHHCACLLQIESWNFNCWCRGCQFLTLSSPLWRNFRRMSHDAIIHKIPKCCQQITTLCSTKPFVLSARIHTKYSHKDSLGKELSFSFPVCIYMLLELFLAAVQLYL